MDVCTSYGCISFGKAELALKPDLLTQSDKNAAFH